MIDRLRNDLNKFGAYNPGMADGGPVQDMPQDTGEENDEKTQMDMIKTTLQKLIDDMNTLEAGRIAPPKPDASTPPAPLGLSEGSHGIPRPNEDDAETPDEAEPENQDNQHGELDPNILKTLLEKAGSSDEDGSLPEDVEHEFPQEVQNAVNEKRKARHNIKD